MVFNFRYSIPDFPLVLKKYLDLLRVSHWVKNTFVLAPLFFSGQFGDATKLKSGILAFVAMCLGSSAVYIFNDLIDAENDRLHPQKQLRPIAQKTVSETAAKVILVALAVIALSGAFYINNLAGLFLAGYLFTNVLYSSWLKHFPVVDIAFIGFGFVLRIMLGGAATEIILSHWLVVMTFVLALFLALGKRHDDLLILEKTGTQMRKSLDGYNLKFTSHGMTLLAGALFLLYFQYLHNAPASILLQEKASYISSIFVLLGMLRYLQATFVYEKSGSPVVQLLTDRMLQFIVLSWLSHFIYMLYF